jgi:hypothetical protein
MVDNPSQNYGMMLRLLSESHYRCLLFASSDHPDASLHPKIAVTYLPEDTACFTYQNGLCDGMDALIGDCVPCGYDTSNFGDSQEMNALAWTNNGHASNHRSLIKWNFDNIPSNATVISADLTLFYNPSSVNAGGLHSATSGTNDAYLLKVTSSWDENTVTWNNQPTTTTVNQVYLPASISPTQDYTNIDVTALVQDLISDPNANNGLMLQLLTESYYRCLLFASSDHPDASKHPKLNLCYTVLDNAISEYASGSDEFSIYPNPNTGSFTITLKDLKNSNQIEIFNSIGELVYSNYKIDHSSDKQLNFSFASGIYFARLIGKDKSLTKKIVIN